MGAVMRPYIVAGVILGALTAYAVMAAVGGVL
jgi:hypothetical protein